MEGSKENPVKLDEVVITPDLSFDFDAAKDELFKSGYSVLQVDSINALVSEYNIQGERNEAQLSYILATSYHEAYDYDGKSTGRIQRLVPIKEKGGNQYLKSKKYYPYIGLGFVQITWRTNYNKFAPLIKSRFGVDILDNPEHLLRVDIAAFVAVYGMVKGLFTGKNLSDYINDIKTDFKNSRKIINGTDAQDLIVGYSQSFLKYIK